MTQEEQNLSEICKFIILNLSSIRIIDSSYRFRNIFSTSLGILINESAIIQDLIKEGMIKSEGLIDKSPFYKFISCTEKGKKYYDNNIYKVIIPESYFSEKRLDFKCVFITIEQPKLIRNIRV